LSGHLLVGPLELDRLERELDNLRAALEWWIETGEEQAGFRLAEVLYQLWTVRGYPAEGRERLARLLAVEKTGEPSPARARALGNVAELAWVQQDLPGMRAALEEMLRIARELNDGRLIAGALSWLGNLTSVEEGSLETLRTLSEERLATCRQLGDEASIAAALSTLAWVSSAEGDGGAAQKLLEESLAIQRRLGNEYGIVEALANLAVVLRQEGDLSGAQARLEEALAIQRGLGERQGNDFGTVWWLHRLGQAASALGNHEAAQELFEEGLAISRECGYDSGEWWGLLYLGYCGLDQEQFAEARAFFEQLLARAYEPGNRAIALGCLGDVTRRQGDYAMAQQLYEEELSLRRALHNKRGIAEVLFSLGDAARHQGDSRRAEKLIKESLALREVHGNPRGIGPCLVELARLAQDQRQYERAAHLLAAATVQRETKGTPAPPPERVDDDRLVAAARAALGEEAFAAAWAEGRSMSLGEAVQFALA
jgi:tetratricopeptide (TPR) repeat protein